MSYVTNCGWGARPGAAGITASNSIPRGMLSANWRSNCVQATRDVNSINAV